MRDAQGVNLRARLDLDRAKTHKAASIFMNVASACSKKPLTMLLENSRSSSSSSISSICSKVVGSIASPQSGSSGDPSDYQRNVSQRLDHIASAIVIERKREIPRHSPSEPPSCRTAIQVVQACERARVVGSMTSLSTYRVMVTPGMD